MIMGNETAQSAADDGPRLVGACMSKFILDNCLSDSLKPYFPSGSVKRTIEYGLKSNAEDNPEVVALAFRQKAILVTKDIKMIEHCKAYQKTLSRKLDRKCVFGLLLLPDGEESQKRVLGDIKSGRRKLHHKQYKGQVAWEYVRTDNLVVNARTPDLQIQELCDCKWEGDED
jgi:hypothetical protein